MLTVIDEFTRRCLAIVVARKLNSDDALGCLLFVAHGAPENVRSDNGPEFVARNVSAWLGRIGVKTLFIEPGNPCENGYCESFNAKLRDPANPRSCTPTQHNHYSSDWNPSVIRTFSKLTANTSSNG
jgi:transposase InsO family protein